MYPEAENDDIQVIKLNRPEVKVFDIELSIFHNCFRVDKSLHRICEPLCSDLLGFVWLQYSFLRGEGITSLQNG